MRKSSIYFKFDNFPFNIGAHEKKYPQIPERLPFFSKFDQRLGLITQRLTKVQKAALRNYYLIGGYASTPLGEGSFGDRRATQTLDFIKKSLSSNKRSFKELSFFEIGCASGFLLYLIKKAGAKEAWGLEPGRKGIKASKRYRLKIINDFFPTEKIQRKFDYILSHCVLEHLENPKKALKHMCSVLNPDGIIFVAVPGVEEKMLLGDPSVLTHQHVNYFTGNSLRGLLTMAGLVNVKVFNSDQAAMLYGWGTHRKTKKGTKKIVGGNGAVLIKKYVINFGMNIKTVQKLVSTYEKKGRKIGLYGDCGVLRGLINFESEPRIFDGDSKKTGKYMACSQNKFESIQQLVKNPVDILLITPIDYDDEIKNDLRKAGFSDKIAKLISLKDIYEKNSGIKYTIGGSSPR